MQSVQEQREDQLGEVLALGRASLGAYCAALYPAFELPPHIRFLIAKLEQVERGDIRRLIVTLPPRHGKSMLCSQYFPAWFLGRNPTQHVITASHTEELSAVFGRRTRNLVSDAHHRAIFPACTLTADSGAASRFELTAGGSFLSVGRGSAVTGHGGTLVIVDDPVADAEQARSETVRRSVREWFESALYTRMPADGRMVLVMTRWHEDDLAGWLLREHAADGWEVVSLPAIAEADDAVGRREGEPLWPERFPLPVLEAIKRAIGSYPWSALYQQRPQPEEGGIIQRAWCTKFYREPPKDLGIMVQSWDCTFKNTSKSDFVAGHVWGLAGADFYLLDRIHARLDLPATMAAIRTLSARWPRAYGKLVESKANGDAVVQMLRGSVSGLILVEPRGGKESRLQSVSPLFQAGNIVLPDPTIAPWIEDVIAEWCGFPNARHDDDCDAASQALLYIETQRARGDVRVCFWTGSGRSMSMNEFANMDAAAWELWRSAR